MALLVYNSTIKSKKKICKSCSTPQYIFSRGRCRQCARGEDAKPLKKISDKVREVPKRDSGELQRWFEERHKEMSGKCANCSGRTQKNADNYKCSVAHILPKAYFPSIATNENNFIELCFYGNSCHTQMDNKMLDMTEMACWDEIVVKFQKMYPYIAEKEKRRIPTILLQYINTDL